MAKMSSILRHQGLQLILAYSWARPAILVAGKGSEGMILFLLFLHFHSFLAPLNEVQEELLHHNYVTVLYELIFSRPFDRLVNT